MGEAREDREKVIVRTSLIGILANLFLAGFKAAVGLAAHSVAVLSDAVNNLSDALSSVITIIGARLAGRAPDKKHPMGHGRIEYMSAMVVAAIVLYAGISTLVDSVKKIIHPEEVSYTAVSLVILAAAVIVKILLGAYTKKKGESVNSGSLVASGQDASQDAILSASVLASALLYRLFSIKIEAWVGAVIAVFIIKAGFEMVTDAADDILGVRVSSEISVGIKKTILQDPDVHGVYDLIVNNYGPDRYLASAHIEVDDTMTAREIDALTRRLQQRVYEENGIILGTVGVYSVNTGDDEAGRIREDIRRRVMKREGVLQFHGFFLDEAEKRLTFDVILDFAVGDRQALYREICDEIRAAYPDYSVQVTLDVDVSD